MRTRPSRRAPSAGTAWPLPATRSSASWASRHCRASPPGSSAMAASPQPPARSLNGAPPRASGRGRARSRPLFRASAPPPPPPPPSPFSARRPGPAPLAPIVPRARRAALRPPAVAVIGEVARLRKRLSWFEHRPLFGKRVLVTRASDKAEPFADQLEALGAEVERLPAIELAPVRSNGAFNNAVKELPHSDWVFFTSPEGIGWFSKLLRPHYRDLRVLAGCHIGAIGIKTAAAIESHGLHVDFVPKRFSQEGVLADFPRRLLRGKRALILGAEESRDALETGLRRRGMRVTKVPIYQTVVPRTLRQGIATLFERPFDFVTVTSASCVEHLADALRAAGRPQVFRRLRFASIGPVTSAEARSRGGRVAVEAGE